MKLYIESKLNEDINPQFAVINTKTGKYAGDPCLSKEEAGELAAQDEDRRIFSLHKESYGHVPIYEYLNDDLIDDSRFIQNTLDAIHYYGTDELVKILKNIFYEIESDSLIEYFVSKNINNECSSEDIIDSIRYIDETGVEG